MGRGRSPATRGGGSGKASDSSLATIMTDEEAYELVENEHLTSEQKMSVEDYISNTDFDGQGHSLSQTMNYLTDQGVDFEKATASEINDKYGILLTDSDVARMRTVSRELDSAMHPLGRPTVLERGAHDDLLRDQFGIDDYSSMSESQLKSRLVGQAFQNTSHMSTAYDPNKNPFTSKTSRVSGGREVIYNIKAGSDTKAVFGAITQSEIVIGKGTNFRITDVRYSGVTAKPRGKASRPQIIVDVETF